MLEDIAVLTGGQVITEDLGLELKSANVTQLGRAGKVVITKNTTIVEGAGDSDQIAARVNQIKVQLEETTSEFDKKNYKSVLRNWPAVLLSSKLRCN